MPHQLASAPRIAIYGIGQYGSHIARMAVSKGWPIVAAYNRAGAKVGRDLGQLIGLERDLGVVVEDCELADYSQLNADIAVVATTNLLQQNLPAYRRLIGAGANVLCHGAQSYFPFYQDADSAEVIDALAKAHGVSFTGSGIWDMSRIWAGMLVASPCTDINSLFHSSITDAEVQAITPEQAALVGCGMTRDEFFSKGMDRSPMAGTYVSIPQQVLFGLGYQLAETRCRIEPVCVDTTVDTRLLGALEPGRVLGSRIIVDVDTVEGVSAKAEIDVRFFQPGEIEHMFWLVDGMPHYSIRTERSDSDYATAASLFNRIPDVIAARPGIVTVSELGPPRPTALIRGADAQG